MNRKVINGLLLLAAATAGCGTFTSCKDTDEDYRNEIAITQNKLQGAIDALTERVNAIKSCTCDLEGAIAKLKAELQAEIDEVKGDLNKLDGRVSDIEEKIKQIAELQSAVDALNKRMEKAEEAINTAQETANKAQESADKAQESADKAQEAANKALDLIAEQATVIEQMKTDLEAKINAVDSKVDGLSEDLQGVKDRLQKLEDLDIAKRLTQVEKDAAAALAQAETNKQQIDLLKASVQSLETEIPQIKGRIDGIDQEIETLNNTVTGILDDISALENEVALNTANISAIREYIDTHKEAFEALQNRVEKIFDILNDRLNKLVTGINVNGVYNHVFGTFNTPFGIRNNMLLGYFGMATQSFTWPSQSTAANYDGPNNPVITANDVQRLREAGLVPVEFTGGKMYMNNDGHNLGQLYSTVNPTDRDFNGLRPELVTSTNELAPIETMRLRPAGDCRLDFGITRAQSETPNGFYVADINVNVDDPAKVRELQLKVEPGLKTAFKDALLDRTKADLAKLAKLLYEQLNGVCPAYAMKVSWDDPSSLDKEGNPVITKKSVMSQYDLAVATVQPLGYSFAVDFSTDKRLKEITPLTEIIDRIFNDAKNDIQIKINLNMKEFTCDLDFSQYITDLKNSKITIDLTGQPVYDENGKLIGTVGDENHPVQITLTYQGGQVGDAGAGALKPLIDALANALGGIESQVESQVVAQVKTIIDDMNRQLKGLQADLNGQIEDILDKIQSQLNGHLGRVDNVINKLNVLIGKINNILANPNNYLQVMMTYWGADKAMHHLSTSLYDPTLLKKGNENGLELFATSYTAELIAPSYKKVVGVTNVYKNGVEAPNASALAKKINTAKGSLAEVVNGNIQRFGVNADEMEAGYTYEFLYTSVDYRGYVSSRKYYIQVVD